MTLSYKLGLVTPPVMLFPKCWEILCLTRFHGLMDQPLHQNHPSMFCSTSPVIWAEVYLFTPDDSVPIRDLKIDELKLLALSKLSNSNNL